MSQTITIPDGLYDATRSLYHNWPVVVAVLVGALVISVVVEVIKHRYTKRQLEKMKSETAQKLLALAALVFAGLGYLVPFLQTNLDVMRSLPYVGEFAISIYAFANLLYAVRLKSWYKVAAGWLTREAKEDTAEVPQEVPAVLPVESSDNLLS
jgi:FtsH-binding integral membrane protein